MSARFIYSELISFGSLTNVSLLRHKQQTLTNTHSLLTGHHHLTEICLTVPRHRRRRLQVCCDARPAGISPPTTALLHDLTLPHVTHGCCQHNHDFKNSEYSAEARTTNYKCTIFCLLAHNLVCQQSINKPKHRLCSVTFSFVSCAINQYTSHQGCSLSLDVSVSRRSFQTSRSRLGLVETWEGLGLDLVSD